MTPEDSYHPHTYIITYIETHQETSPTHATLLQWSNNRFPANDGTATIAEEFAAHGWRRVFSPLFSDVMQQLVDSAATNYDTS